MYRMFKEKHDRETTKKSDSILTMGKIKVIKEPMKILLIFPHVDEQVKAFQAAATQLQFPCDSVHRVDGAIDRCALHRPHVVIVDMRQSRVFDGEAACKLIRSSDEHTDVIIIAITKALSDPRSEDSILPLIKVGFNKRWQENQSVTSCMNELIMLEQNEFQSMARIRVMEAGFAALDKVTDCVEILNSNYKIEYVNSTFERLHGYSSAEVLGVDPREMHKLDGPGHENYESILHQVKSGKHWEGTLCERHKSGSVLFCTSELIPVFGKSGRLNHIVAIKRVSQGKDIMTLVDRADSFNASSQSLNGRRRESMAKMQNMTIDGPINKVISIISSVQTASPTVAHDLQTVLEILNTTDLYSASINAENNPDQVTSDLVEGLMTNSKVMTDRHEKRRKSSVAPPLWKRTTARTSEVLTEHINQVLERHSMVDLKYTSVEDIPEEIASALEDDHELSYDILELERVTSKRPMVFLGMKVFERFGVSQFLKISQDTLRNWLQVIEDNYHADNFYHNASHGADVMQCAAYYLERDRIKAIMEPIDEVSTVLAAIVHDVDHPGRTNPFLINSGNRLAVLYNDIAVLESHHVSLSFQLTKKDERINIFKNLDKDDYRLLRQYMIDMVLATEMAKHFEHLAKFVNNVAKPLMKTAIEEKEVSGSSRKDSLSSLDPDEYIMRMQAHENRSIIKRMLIKCSDVSNPTRPLKLCKEWAVRISEEYFSQTEEEKKSGLPVVMPVFDRLTCDVPKSQTSFIDFFLKNMFDAWDAFCDVPEALSNLQINYDYWKSEAEKAAAEKMKIEEENS